MTVSTPSSNLGRHVFGVAALGDWFLCSSCGHVALSGYPSYRCSGHIVSSLADRQTCAQGNSLVSQVCECEECLGGVHGVSFSCTVSVNPRRSLTPRVVRMAPYCAGLPSWQLPALS